MIGLLNNKININEYNILSNMLYEYNVNNSFKENNNKAVKIACFGINKYGKVISKGFADNTIDTNNNRYYNVHRAVKHYGLHAEIEMLFGLRSRNNNTEYNYNIYTDIKNKYGKHVLDINMGRSKFADDVDEQEFINMKSISTRHLFIDTNKIDYILISKLNKRSDLTRHEKKLGWINETCYLGDSEPCIACFTNLYSYFKNTNVKLIYKKNNNWVSTMF